MLYTCKSNGSRAKAVVIRHSHQTLDLAFAAFTAKGIDHGLQAHRWQLLLPDRGEGALGGAASDEQHRPLKAQALQFTAQFPSRPRTLHIPRWSPEDSQGPLVDAAEIGAVGHGLRRSALA